MNIWYQILDTYTITTKMLKKMNACWMHFKTHANF